MISQWRLLLVLSRSIEHGQTGGFSVYVFTHVQNTVCALCFRHRHHVVPYEWRPSRYLHSIVFPYL